MSEQVRLNKFLATAGVCSRRKADRLISSGRVFVSGSQVTELGSKIDPEKDRVEVEGLGPVDGSYSPPVYIMLNKPVRVISSVHDPQERKTVMDFLPQKIRDARVYPIGRLDYFSQGLILLTNDGELAHKLTHPGFEHPKSYHLDIREKVPENILEKMRTGMVLEEGEELAPVEVKKIFTDREKTRLEMVLIQGINRQIRRMCRDAGLTILKLERIAHSGVSLGSLAPGKWRYLSTEEIKILQSKST